MNDIAELLEALQIERDEVLSVGWREIGKPFSGGRRLAGDLAAMSTTLNCDVWLGVNPLNLAPVLQGPRGTEDDVMRIPALVADIDIRHQEVKPEGGMPDEQSAQAVIDDLSAILGSPPVAVVSSGHGYQPYWAVETLSSVDVPTMRVRVARFSTLVQRLGRMRGGELDRLSDAARVWRAPGTMNYKAAPAPVTLRLIGGRPLTGAEIDEALDAYAVPASSLSGSEPDPVDMAAVPWAEQTCGYAAAMAAGWADDAPTARHPWLVSQTTRLEAARRYGCVTKADYEAARGVLKERFAVLVAGDPARRSEAALARVWALDCVSRKTTAQVAAELGGHAHDSVSAVEGFFDSHPLLRLVRTAAHARVVSPWAVLGCLLARVVSEVGPEVRLPPIIGSHASLNLYVGLVGPSGSGKSAAYAVSGDLLPPSPRVQLISAGTGEGVISTFLQWDQNRFVLREHPQALLYADEVDQLGQTQARAGSTVASVLRTMWSGSPVGTANADRERRRELRAHTYRLSVVAGIQPELSDVLLRDVSAGTPQRWLWLPSQDAGLPDEAPAWPGELGWTRPRVPGVMDMPVPVEAVDAIRSSRVAMMRGEGSPLDGHALLTRLKLAAAFALLLGELSVTQECWALAGVLQQVSDGQRGRCEAALAARRDAEAFSKGRADALRSAASAEAAVERLSPLAVLLWRTVSSQGHPNMKHGPSDGCTHRCLVFALRNHAKKGIPVDEVAALAERLGWVQRDGDRWMPGPEKPSV